MLASLVLHGDADSRGQVCYADGRLGFVDMLCSVSVARRFVRYGYATHLPSGTSGPHDFQLDLIHGEEAVIGVARWLCVLGQWKHLTNRRELKRACVELQ